MNSDARLESRLDGIASMVVLRPSAVGDFVFALPCLHALKAAYPDARIDYVGLPWHATFLAGRPGPVDQVHVMPPCAGIGTATCSQLDADASERFVQRMRGRHFDLALQIYGGGRYANPFIRRFGARHCIGLKSQEAIAPDRWIHDGPLQNRRLQLLEVASLIGAGIDVMQGPELEVTDRDRREADAVLPPSAGQALVLLQPGASDRRRRWAVPHFAVVGDSLAAAGLQVAVIGSCDERSLVADVCQHMRYAAIDLAGRLGLGGLCGLLARSALLVSNDTGPLHLALAIGTRCVGLYWLTNLIESGPLRQQHHRALLSTRVDCPVCGAPNLNHRCEHEVSFIDDIGIDAVMLAARDLLARPDPRTGR